METLLKGKLLFFYQKIWLLSHLPPSVVDMKSVAESVSEHEHFAERHHWYILLNSQPERSVSAFSVNREDLHALALVPYISSVAVKP